MIKVGIVDDHKIVRDGIKALLKYEEDIQVIFEAGSSEEFFGVSKENPADILILDIVLPTLSGIEIAQQLLETEGGPAIIILTGSAEYEYVMAALETGVKGFLPKDSAQEELLNAIRTVSDGKEYFADTVAKTVLKAHVDQARKKISEEAEMPKIPLTDRETEIVKLFFEGLSYKQIADRLFISRRTVESHKNNIMEKLELKTMTDLFKFALRSGIVEL
ncbi:MAG: response regulator transcription factor [Bacteroidetes bacterium]|nr:response regulator transcription factor [Bacteroidota bacterium]